LFQSEQRLAEVRGWSSSSAQAATVDRVDPTLTTTIVRPRW